MANIKNFINHDGATFNDNSITINATQNNNNVEVQPQVNTTADVTASAEQHTPNSPADFPNIVFDGNKTDLARVINAAVLKRCFKRPDGTLATQEEVFTLFDNRRKCLPYLIKYLERGSRTMNNYYIRQRMRV